MANHPNRSRRVTAADVAELQKLCITQWELVKVYPWRDAHAKRLATEHLDICVSIVRKIQRGIINEQ